jgi:translation initiation factor 3 subunit G
MLEVRSYCLDGVHPSAYTVVADTGAGPDDDIAPSNDTGAAAPAGSSSTGGKYVPPSMRFGAGRGAGESMGRPGGSRDDLPTLRVTNISEDTQENDLRELFGGFGRVARVYVGRDRETGAGKGFAFVSFEDRANAQKAMEKVHGKGYDNLILSVQWSRKCCVYSFLNIGLMYSVCLRTET